MEEKAKRKGIPRFNLLQKGALVLLLTVIYGLGTRAIFGGFPFSNRLEINVVSASFIFGMPVGIGAITAFFVGDKYLRGLVISLGLMSFVLGLTVIFAFEVWICVLMAAVPMLAIAGVVYMLIVIVTLLWNHFNPSDEKPKRMNAVSLLVFLLIPYLFAPIEAQLKTPDFFQTVEDSILINSSAESVWNNIIFVDTISSAEHSATFFQTMGIPRPLRATMRETGVGALRRGEFADGLLFQEVVRVWQPYEEITFDVRTNHNNLEISALAQIGGEYLEITETGYRIEDLGGGQVRLHLHSIYRVTTNFNGYAAIWADWIIHDFQGYILKILKARAES